VTGLVCHVREVSLAVVLEQLANPVLRDEQVKVAIVVEVTEYGTDATRLVRDPTILGLNAAVLLVEHEQTPAGAIQEVAPSIAGNVGNGEGVTLDTAADALGSQADLVGDVLEPPVGRRPDDGSLARPRRGSGLRRREFAGIAIESQAVEPVAEQD